MSCDEEVIARLGKGVKTDYSMSLVSFARKSNGSKYIVVPVAFSNKASGRKEVKMRVKNILGYKGTSKLISTAALVLVAGVGLVCLFNARTFADENEDPAAAEETAAEDICETTEVAGINNADIGDNGVEVIVDGEDGSVTFIPEDGETQADEDTQAEDDQSSPDVNNAPQAQTADVQMKSDTILGTDIPVLTGVSIDAELNLPAGTRVEDHPELDIYLAPDSTLESDAYAVFYKHAIDQNLMEKYITALKDAGYDNVIDNGVVGYMATNSNGLTVIVENIPDCDYFRVSFFTLVDGTHAFARLG